MPYTLPAWQDAPSTATPISAANLTQANTAINSIDSRLTTVETGKLSTGLVNAQGNLISGDNTGTPRALLVGTDGQVLTADHTTATGLKWAAPAGASTPDATTTTKGIVQLAGDLAGTAAAPAINATGTPSSTTFLRGDKTWATPAGGGGTSVITTQGDLIAGNASGVASRLSPIALVAFDGDYLTYDSAQPLGYRYQHPPLVINRTQNQSIDLPFQPKLNFTGPAVVAADGVGATNVTINGTLNSGSAFSTITTSSSNSIASVIPGGNLRVIVTSSDSVISIKDPDPLGASANNPYITYVTVEQDSVGGHFWQINPMTIVWENGWGPTTQNSPWDLSPGSITLMRFEWMGSQYGWMGKLLTAVPPLTTPLPSTWTNSLGNHTITTNSTTQNLNLGANAYSARYCLTSDIKTAMDALTQFFSPALRQRLANSGKLYFEINHRFPTGGIMGNYLRGVYDQVGGYISNIDATHFLTAMSLWRNDTDPVTGLGNDAGIVVHETCHAISSLYYGGGAAGGANPNEIGLASTNVLSQHPPIKAIQDESIAAGGGPTSFSDEWFAEVESGRRKLLNSQQLAQMGTGNSPSGRTPQQRVDAYNSLMASLPGMIL